jgi:tetratricopeptide (TPR) repeat protein
MSLKEIEKLREKVEKDANSKLFVPLAEEYRKEGMLDEAIDVLLKGIESQPGYMSARVSLGKIYLEKGMPGEARTEFENVVRSIPDNLYAQKKLAEIYRDTGERELAIKFYRTVLRLNSMDEEALSSLRNLEDSEEDTPPPPGAADTAPEVMEKVQSLGPSQPQEEMEAPAGVLPEEPAGEQEAIAGETDDALRAFKDSLFGMGEAGGEEPGVEMAGADTGEDDTLEVLEEPAEEPGSDVSFEEINAALKNEAQAVQVAEEGPEAFEEELTLAEEVTPVEEDITAAAAAAPFFAEAAPQRKGPTLEEAERRISEGNYAGAINVYRNILTLHPGDKRTLQRLEELKVLLKLLGRDKEVLIERLDAFLEGVGKRHDEFLRRS